MLVGAPAGARGKLPLGSPGCGLAFHMGFALSEGLDEGPRGRGPCLSPPAGYPANWLSLKFKATGITNPCRLCRSSPWPPAGGATRAGGWHRLAWGTGSSNAASGWAFSDHGEKGKTHVAAALPGWNGLGWRRPTCSPQRE